MIRQVCLLALLVAASAGRIGMESDVLFGSAPNWSRAGRAGAEDEVTATFMLKHSDMQLAKLEETFWAVSDPKNPRYGEHLTQSQVTDLMAPSVESVNVVTDFLAAHNVSYSVGVHRDIIEASIPAAVAEDMFQTQFFHYTHARTQKSLIRAAAAYSLPSEIAAVLKLVGGLVRFPRMDGVKKVELSSENAVGWDNGCGSSCPNFVTPAILTQRYNLGSAPTSAKGSMAVSEFQGVDWDQTGLDTLKAACSLNVSLTVDKQIGSNFPLKCRVPLLGTELCAEAMLDIEYIKALGGAIPLTDIFNSQYSLESWAKQLEDMPDGTLPLVHSVSYGDDEAQQTGDAFIQAANVEFQKLGVRGISVLFASGDQGVLGRSGRGTRFHPDFPASSPYITAVGGTDFVTKSVVGDEKAWTDGGGAFLITLQSQVIRLMRLPRTRLLLVPRSLHSHTGTTLAEDIPTSQHLEVNRTHTVSR